MKRPTLTAVVPNYNHGKYLPINIAAIARQSVPADEIVVVDDASTDNSLEVLEDLRRQFPTLKVYRNPVNLGVAGAVNHALAVATGDVIYLGAADDEVMPGLFEKLLGALAENPQAGMAAGICRMYQTETNLSYDFGRHVASEACYLSPQQIGDLVRHGRFLVSCTAMLWRRDALAKAGNYRKELRWHTDWWPLFATGFRYGMAFVPEVLAEFRSIPTSISNAGMKKLKPQVEIMRCILNLLESPENQDVAPLIRRNGALASFGKEMLFAIFSRRRNWKNLNLTYLRLALWWTLRIEAKKILPRPVARLYFKMAGVSSEAPAA